jgi:O-antigen ligase
MIYFYIIKAMPITARLGVPEFNVPVNSIGLIAGYSLLIALSMFKLKNKLYLKLVFLLFILNSSLAILLSGTIGAIIGVIFPILTLLPKNKRKMSVFILFFLILLSLLPTKHILSRINIKFQSKVRPAIWYSYFQVIKEQPVIGTGFGMEIYNPIFLEKFNAHLPDEIKKYGPFHPHNIIVDITVRTGIVGLILFLYIIVSSLWVTTNTVKKTEDHFIKNWSLCITAVFTSILIQSMFTDILLVKQAYLFYLTLSLMTILWRLDAES